MEQQSVKTQHVMVLPWVVCILGALFYGYEYLLRVAPSIMTGDLMFAFNIQKAVILGNLSAYYFYIYAPMQIPVGMLMDRYGVRRVLTLAALASALGAYFFACAHGLLFAEFGRFLIGFGASFAFIGVLKLAIHWLPEDRFGLISGITLAIGMVGAVLGEVLLTELRNFEGWRLAHSFVAVFGVILALLLWLVLRSGAKRTHVVTKKLSVRFRAIFYAFLITLRNRQIWVNGAIGSLLYLPISVFAGLWGVPFLEQVYNLTNVHAAEIISLIFIGWAVGAFLSGWLSDLLKQRRLFLTTGATFAAILSSAVFYIPNISVFAIAILFFLIGMFSGVQVLVFAIAKELSYNKVIGTTIGVVNTFVVFMGVLFQPLMGWLLDLSWSGKVVANMHYFSANDYQNAFAIIPGALILAVFLTFFLRETGCRGL
ncbi:MAG: MFS transporter [Gammaproteobacteria bacterium]|nr:MFS transporter [Gammaproteobacteria bacterium]